MSNRTLGEIIAVSIATAVPLEVLVKKEKKLPYGSFFMNVQTLFRNLHGACNTVEIPSADVLASELVEEMATIAATVTATFPGSVIPVFYLNTYKSLPKIFPRAKLKIPHTDKQKEYYRLEWDVYSVIKKKFPDVWEAIQHGDCLISGNNTVALILTHYPVDLLSSHTFRKLTLIESHTGEIKEANQWYTKLNNPEKYKNLPFGAMALQVIGDGGGHFYSLGRKYVQALELVSEEKNWTPSTSIPKIKFDLGRWKDAFSAGILLDMVVAKLR